MTRTIGISALVVAIGFAAAFWVHDEAASWLFFSLGVVTALVLAVRSARGSDAAPLASVAWFLAFVLATAGLAVVLIAAFLTVECQSFDNCVVN